jgi:hypothetical protein
MLFVKDARIGLPLLGIGVAEYASAAMKKITPPYADVEADNSRFIKMKPKKLRRRDEACVRSK